MREGCYVVETLGFGLWALGIAQSLSGERYLGVPVISLRNGHPLGQ